MRLNVKIDNPLNNTAKVYLDGAEQSYCTIADEERGYIVRYVFDEDGTMKTYPDGNALVTEKIFGKVEIKV